MSGALPSSCLRSLFTMSTAMLMFAARIYHTPELNDFLKSHTSNDVSHLPCLPISSTKKPDFGVIRKKEVNGKKKRKKKKKKKKPDFGNGIHELMLVSTHWMSM